MKVTVVFDNHRTPERYDGVTAIHTSNGGAILEFGGTEIELSEVRGIHARDD